MEAACGDEAAATMAMAMAGARVSVSHVRIVSDGHSRKARKHESCPLLPGIQLLTNAKAAVLS